MIPFSPWWPRFWECSRTSVAMSLSWVLVTGTVIPGEHTLGGGFEKGGKEEREEVSAP